MVRMVWYGGFEDASYNIRTKGVSECLLVLGRPPISTDEHAFLDEEQEESDVVRRAVSADVIRVLNNQS